MTDFLDAYSIQNWPETCPQADFEDTERGHGIGETESDLECQMPVAI